MNTLHRFTVILKNRKITLKKLKDMLQIVFNQLNKPTNGNFRKLAIIAYELTGLEFYNYYVSNYYSTAVRQDFFSQFWQLRNEVKQLIK